MEIRDAENGRRLFALRGHTAGVTIRCVAWNRDGTKLASVSNDGKLIFWSPDGTRLASGGEDKTARLWSLATGAEALPPMRHSGWVNSIDWLADEKHPRLVCATNAGSVSIWDPLTGKLALTLKSSRLTGPRACWNPDGRQLASASGRFLHVWDAAPNRPRLQVPDSGE